MSTPLPRPSIPLLSTKPDCAEALARVAAWLRGDILGRPPIRFSAHNSEYGNRDRSLGRSWANLEARWRDITYQIDLFEHDLQHGSYLAETFPVYWPNLGPGVYAAMHGSHVAFGEVTSWTEPVKEPRSVAMNWQHPYLADLDAMTRLSLERSQGRWYTGYTDLHGSLDCVADWRSPQQLCMDLMDDPELVDDLLVVAEKSFVSVFDHYDRMLKAANQPSVNWMGIPVDGRLHIPSCDFAFMISPKQYKRFYEPALTREIAAMTHNIFHLDGKGVARHVDSLLASPHIHAIQWVQGCGTDRPIMQWLPLIKKIQDAGKGVIVDLAPSELEEFIRSTTPRGIYFCIDAPVKDQQAIIERVARW